MKDTRTLLRALAEGNPFATHTNLINIGMLSVHPESSVNLEKAREVGQSILNSMTGKPAAEYSFTKTNQAIIAFSAKSSVNVHGEKIQVDPKLLFQRVIIASQSPDDMSAIFKYELCSYPPSLFDSSLMLLKLQKPALADAIWAKRLSGATGPKDEVQYMCVLDRIPRPRGFPKYREINDMYCQYVTRTYVAAVVIFDGYN